MVVPRPLLYKRDALRSATLPDRAREERRQVDKHFSEPAEVKVKGGEVVVDCPDGKSTAFTPEAALKTAQRLGDMAVEAIIERGQAEAEATKPSTDDKR